MYTRTHVYMYTCTQGVYPRGKPLVRCAVIRSDGRPNRCSVLQRFFCHAKVGLPLLFQCITPSLRGIHAWCPVRSRIQCALAGWLPSGCPPSRPPVGGSPAHHPRRRSVRAALSRLPRHFVPTSPPSGCPHRPPSSRVECMMCGSGVRALAGCAPVHSLRYRFVRSARPPSQRFGVPRGSVCVRWLAVRPFAHCAIASFAPPAHPASVWKMLSI